MLFLPHTFNPPPILSSPFRSSYPSLMLSLLLSRLPPPVFTKSSLPMQSVLPFSLFSHSPSASQYVSPLLPPPAECSFPSLTIHHPPCFLLLSMFLFLQRPYPQPPPISSFFSSLYVPPDAPKIILVYHHCLTSSMFPRHASRHSAGSPFCSGFPWFLYFPVVCFICRTQIIIHCYFTSLFLLGSFSYSFLVP